MEQSTERLMLKPRLTPHSPGRLLAKLALTPLLLRTSVCRHAHAFRRPGVVFVADSRDSTAEQHSGGTTPPDRRKAKQGAREAEIWEHVRASAYVAASNVQASIVIIATLGAIYLVLSRLYNGQKKNKGMKSTRGRWVLI